jgi:4-hydroxy-4-methyl-2-oxoglutarate aldolase
MKNILIKFVFLAFLLPGFAFSQITPSKEQIEFYTANWKGERFPDGRPKVPDNLLERLKKISIEEAWGILQGEGYNNQFEGNWKILHPEQVFVGRALTAVYMPLRPDLNKKIIDKGREEGRIGSPNSWPIDMLQNGDVYVADCYGKIIDGTLIGDNLGNSIFSKTKTGVVFDGGVRDIEGLDEIDGFNAFVRGFDPSYLKETMLTGINFPVTIGRATVLPGDAILAKKEGVIFIPSHLLDKVVINAEFIALKDKFGHQRLREGKYSPGQIDMAWSDEIILDFKKWIDDNPSYLPMPKNELEEFMKSRNW